MKANQVDRKTLPIKRSLTLDYTLSIITAILMAIASAGGLLYPHRVYPADELLQAFMPNDVINLVVGLPILVSSMWLTWRGRLVGLLFWPGALFYVFYNYSVYVFGMPFNLMYLLHLALFIVSGYALIIMVASIDGIAIQNRLAGGVAERFAGGVLTGFGVLFLVRVGGVFANALLNQTEIPSTELALNIADLLISPAFVICGILLWQRQAFGYLSGLGLLFQASMLFIGLIAVLILGPFITNAQFALVDVVIVFVMGMICFVPFALFVRGVTSKKG